MKAGVWGNGIDGNVSKEGITRDLTEMSRKGIGRVDIFDVLGAPQVGPAPMMGPLWREMFQHALSEAARCESRSTWLLPPDGESAGRGSMQACNEGN